MNTIRKMLISTMRVMMMVTVRATNPKLSWQAKRGVRSARYAHHLLLEDRHTDGQSQTPSNLVTQDTTTSCKRIKATAQKSNKESNQILSVSNDSTSELVDVELVRNNHGQPVDPEMEYFTQVCKNNDGKIQFHCKGKNVEGKTCPWQSSGCERSHVLRHCKSCHFLGVADREHADSQLANQSTGRKLQAIKLS